MESAGWHFWKHYNTHWGPCVNCWFPENTTPTTYGWSKCNFITHCDKKDYHLDRVFVASLRGEAKDKRYLWGLRSVSGGFFSGGRWGAGVWMGLGRGHDNIGRTGGERWDLGGNLEGGQFSSVLRRDKEASWVVHCSEKMGFPEAPEISNRVIFNVTFLNKNFLE